MMQSLSKEHASSKAQLEENERARIRLEAEVSAGLIEGASLSEELVAVQVCIRVFSLWLPHVTLS